MLTGTLSRNFNTLKFSVKGRERERDQKRDLARVEGPVRRPLSTVWKHLHVMCLSLIDITDPVHIKMIEQSVVVNIYIS